MSQQKTQSLAVWLLDHHAGTLGLSNGQLFRVAAPSHEAQTRKRVVRMAAQLPLSARRLQTESPNRDQALIECIIGLIEQRCALTLRRFNAG
jgi:hypothetical protein